MMGGRSNRAGVRWRCDRAAQDGYVIHGESWGSGGCWARPRTVWSLRRDRDGEGAAADVDRLEGGVGGGPDRGHRAGIAIGDVGGLAVRGDRDREGADPDLDRLEGGVGGGPDRGHRAGGKAVAGVDGVGGLAVRGDRDAEGVAPDLDRFE